MVYKYTFHGTAADGQTWRTTGYVSAPDFPAALDQSQRMSFHQLTQGKAVYGFPGRGGCRGPYNIAKFAIEVVPVGQANALREAGEAAP